MMKNLFWILFLLPSLLASQNIGKVGGVTWSALAKVSTVEKANIAKISTIDAPAGASYLLDTYTGAGAAYSLRKISSSATNAIRIRRSSDDAEQDVGYSGNDLDIASISSFCGGGTGYVVTVYDQSANGYHCISADDLATIYESGSLLTENSLPIIRMNGDHFESGTVTGSHFIASNQCYVYGVTKWATLGSFEYSGMFALYESVGFSAPVSVQSFDFGGESTVAGIGNATHNASYNASISGNKIVEYIYNGSTSAFLYIDDVDETDATSLGNYTPSGTISVILGDQFSTYKTDIQEIVIWPTNQISNRAAIYTDVSTYWN